MNKEQLMADQSSEQQQFPPQQQDRQPGLRSEMEPIPESIKKGYKAADKLKGKVAIITGGDSGIGRAVALAFAAEGADVAVLYLDEHKDAQDTKEQVDAYGRQCMTLAGDVGDESFCQQAVERVIERFGRLDILVNNAAEQHPKKDLTEISTEQLERTFRTNIFSQFFMAKAALPHLREGSTIINTSSVTAYEGSAGLLDYSSTKGAIISFTRSLSANLAEKGIRVNAVAPGPIWTPLIPSTFDEEKVESFGADTPLGRAGQPSEVSPSYVFLASDDSSYITGQVLHPNGGRVVNG
jgi:NAD(P)-dependent dehydrogenase (short-subunit alcohol dehydrogenase family)